MAFRKIAGNMRAIEWYPKTASTLFTKLSAVAFSGGALVNQATTEIAGIIHRDVVATDADYATTGAKVPVELSNPDDIWLVDVIGGTAAMTNVGAKYDIDSTYLGINLNGTTYKSLLVVGYVSATQLLVKIIGTNQNDLS